jgi:hypothetical protein
VTGLGYEKIVFDLYKVPYRKGMTFPEANSDLQKMFRLFSVLLHKNEYITGVLSFKIFFLQKSAHPNAHSVNGLMLSDVKRKC